jgi:hypothetical protein
MQHWAADHQALLDAKLAGVESWTQTEFRPRKAMGPFEAAVRDAAKIRMEHMRAMMEGMRGMTGEDAERRWPMDHIEMMAAHMSEAAAALTKIADAGKPFMQAWMTRRNGPSGGSAANS